MNNDRINKLCELYGIKNYTIKNGLVDVEGDVNLDGGDCINGSLPVKFGYVNGRFSCKNMGLTNLHGSPQISGEAFDCRDNYLTSLEGCP